MVLAMTMAFTGCAKPPEAEQKVARMAMDAAITARADKYAVADMDTALKLFNAAEINMKEKNYDEAKKAYEDAKAGFEKAISDVDAGKKTVAIEATAALTDLEKSWKDLQVDAKIIEKSTKDLKADWETDIKSFEEDLKAGREMITADPAEAKWKAHKLKSIIEKWNTTFKELAVVSAPKTKISKK
jgi:tetratricopeptide (TPR) repeat protein